MSNFTRSIVISAIVGMFFMTLASLSPSVLFAGSRQIERNEAEPAGVETMPNEGRWHLEPGEKWEYKSYPPTSGPHDPKWTRPGFYFEKQPPEKLVHSLEHGIVVI